MTAATTKPRAKRPSVPAPDTSTSHVGLDALTTPAPARAGLVEPIPTVLLHPHPGNPRRDLGDLTELTDSIRSHGVRQNLLAVPDPDRPGEFRLVIGHRRAAAATLAGVEVLPVQIDSTLGDAQQLELMLLENIQRSDLTAVEEADGYQGLLDLGVDVASIARTTGRSASTVRARLKLAALPEPARAAVHEHRATLEDAAALAEFDGDPEAIGTLAEALGSVNFRRALADEQRRRETTVAFKPLLDLLTAQGATCLDPTSWSTPAGSTKAMNTSKHNLTRGESEGMWRVTLERALQILQDLTAGWSYRFKPGYGELEAFRPHTLEEIAAEEARDRQRAERTAQDEVDRAAREAQKEATKAATAAAELSAQTRRDFLRKVLAQPIRGKHRDELIAFTGRQLLLDGWAEEGTFDSNRLAGWLGVDLDAVTKQAETDKVDVTDAWEQAVLARIELTTPEHRLLTAMISRFEPIPHFWFATAPTRDWYALLESLGYPISDAERTALTGQD